MNLFDWSAKHVRAIGLLVLGLAALGVLVAINLPVAIFPNLTIPRIIIAADGGDAPAQSVLISITRPIEEAVSTVPGLVLVQSQTVRGSAGFTLTFTDGADMDKTLQLVNAKIGEIQGTFPPGVTVTAERLNPTVFPILDYSLTSRSVSLSDLKLLALNTIRPRLARVNGVAKVLVNGGEVKQMTVTVKPEKLAAYGIPLSGLADAINKANAVTVTGNYNDRYERHLVVVTGLLTDVRSVENVVVAVKNRVPITVGDLAAVEEGIQRKTVFATGTGKEAVLLNIIRQPDGNTVQVADDVAAEIQSLKSTLPPDVSLTPFYDQSQIVRESASSVIEAIAIGGGLAMIVIAWFLRNVRVAIVALSLLPLSTLISFVALRLMGMSLNIMTLGAMAIALGLVVDDSIVVVEHIFKKLEEGLERRDAVREGMREINPAMFASSFASIVVFLPLILMPGVTGQFFSPLAKTMIATLLISLVLALTVIPILASYLLPRLIGRKQSLSAGSAESSRSSQSNPKPFEGPGAELRAPTLEPPRPLPLPSVGEVGELWRTGREGSGTMKQRSQSARSKKGITAFYGRILASGLRHKWLVLLLIVPIALVAGLLYKNLETGFMPDFDEGAFVMDYKMPAGTSLEETNRVCNQIEQILATTKGVQSWSRLTGALSGSGLEICALNQGDIVIRLTNGDRPDVWTVMNEVRTRVLRAIPNVDLDLAQILSDMIGDLAGSPSPIEVKIFGPDIDKLKDLADKVGDKITPIKDVVDEASGITDSGPEAIVTVKPVEASEQGFSTDTLTSATQGALDGVQAGSVRRGEYLEPILVRYPFNLEYSSKQLSDMPVVNDAGQPIPLSSVSNVNVQEGSPELDRENQRLMDSVTAGLDKVDLGTGVRLVQQKIATIPLPPGYSFEMGGLYKSQQESFSALRNVLLSASALVFIVLLFTFRSYRMAFALFFAAILALSGVVLALWITKTPFNISSYTGAIMIVGIVTENGVLLFDEFRRLKRAEPSMDERHLLVLAGQERLRPILMTTFAAILALLPLALGFGAGAAMQKPLAIAVIGGLTLSMVFTLIFAPILYSVFHAVRQTVVKG